MIKNLLLHKDENITLYSDAVYNHYMKESMGIEMAPAEWDMDTAFLRKELIGWLSRLDNNALTQIGINHQAWLAVTYPKYAAACGFTGYQESSCPIAPCTVGMGYTHSSGTSNIIEVNVGGCITRINVNPNITISTSSKYEHVQSTAATVWVITHNLGFTPNVFAVNQDGQEIVAEIDPIDTNTIHLIFNQAFSGIAYLS